MQRTLLTASISALLAGVAVAALAHNGMQYIAVLSGVGGWAGIGVASGLTNPTEGLGAVGD
jgi:glucose dehydrogenase